MYTCYYKFKTISLLRLKSTMWSLLWYEYLTFALIFLFIAGEYAYRKADRKTLLFLLVDNSLSNSDSPETCAAFDAQTKFLVCWMKDCSGVDPIEHYKRGVEEFTSTHPDESAIILRWRHPRYPHPKSFRMDALGSLQVLFNNLKELPNLVEVTTLLFSHNNVDFKASYAYKDKNINAIEQSSILGDTHPSGGSPIFLGIIKGCEEVLRYATNSNFLRIVYYWIGLAPIIIFSIITDGEDDMDNPNPSQFSLKASREETLVVFKNMIKTFASNYINLKVIVNTTEVGSTSLRILNISGVTFNILQHPKSVVHNFRPTIPRSLTSAVSDSIATQCGINSEDRKDNNLFRSLFYLFGIFYRVHKRRVQNYFTSNPTLVKNAFAKVGVDFIGYNMEDKQCCICWNEVENKTFFNCGHSTCNPCYEEYKKKCPNKCPHCRQRIRMLVATIYRTLTSGYSVQ
jgi:hypothetical protein